MLVRRETGWTLLNWAMPANPGQPLIWRTNIMKKIKLPPKIFWKQLRHIIRISQNLTGTDYCEQAHMPVITIPTWHKF